MGGTKKSGYRTKGFSARPAFQDTLNILCFEKRGYRREGQRNGREKSLTHAPGSKGSDVKIQASSYGLTTQSRGLFKK